MSAERVGHNQALFREVNDRLQELNRRLERDGCTGSFLCECADAACAEEIELTLAEYAELRDHPLRFVVAPGHVLPRYERMVFATDRYTIVEKEGAAAVAAEDASSRSGRA